MARKHNQYNPNKNDGRSATPLASLDHDLLSPVSPSTALSSPLKSDPALEIEDRRQYHPQGPNRWPKSRSQTPSTVLRDRKPSPRQALYKYHPHSQTNSVLAFSQPNSVILCQRRKARREVIFAKRKNRRGGGGPRRRNWTSYISCR